VFVSAPKLTMEIASTVTGYEAMANAIDLASFR
jgi:hypothetical protein